MDKVTRLLLLNQYRLLGATKAIPSKDADDAVKALQQGFALDIEHLIETEVWGEFSSDSCQEVRDILNMYRIIHNSIRRMDAEVQSRLHELPWAVFEGFDGNNETEHYAYTQYLLKDRGLWAELYTQDMSLNTHSETLHKYRTMLSVFKAGRTSGDLSQEEIVAVLNAE